MLQNIVMERKIYASQEHKMMQEIIQKFISNDIMDRLKEWEENGMVSCEI